MRHYLNRFRLYQSAASRISIGLVVCVGLVVVFQNCSNPMKTDVRMNPNLAPVGSASNSPLVAPNTVKTKLIGGVEVSGFDVGTWIHAFVDDRCVLSREGLIKQTPFYFLDPYLKQQYQFEQNVGKFNISLVSFQLTAFMSSSDFEKSLSFDACATGSYASTSSPTSFAYTPPDTKRGFETAWTQMGLDASVLQSLLALNGSTKVNVGIAGLGFKTDLNPPLPLSANSVGLSRGIPNSAGTVLASMIATPQSGISFRGVADGVAELTPIVIPQNVALSQLAFWLVKQAVNRGAEVFVMPFWTANEDFCDPLIGQAFFYAIERGTTIVLPAGSAVGNSLPPTPGEIVGPRDFSLFQSSKTAQGSCWARYFRGVINVASSTNNLGTTEILSSSNYGHEGVELIAPGQDVTGMGDDSMGRLMSGTEVSAALTAGAVAHIVSFYKKKGWFYSPWLVEDTLMNGSNQASNLPDVGRTVRRRKVLNFSSLKNFLTVLDSGSESDSRSQATDNPESGQSISLASLAPGEQPLKLDVYTKASNVFVKDRNQFQAVLYYASGALQVISDTAVWSSSDPTNFPVDIYGVVYPKQVGSFTITARDPVSGRSGSYTAFAVNVDTVTGTNSKLTRLEIRNKYSSSPSIEPFEDGYRLKTMELYLHAYAIYEDGRTRLISNDISVSIMVGNEIVGSGESSSRPLNTLNSFAGNFRGGQWHDLLIFYRGHKEKIRLFMPSYEWVEWRWVPGQFEFRRLVKERSTDRIDIYNFYGWGSSAFKYPVCRFLGVERDCPRNSEDTTRGWRCDLEPCGRLATSTVPPRYSATAPTSGLYQLNQEYQFWGAGSVSTKNSTVAVNLISVPMTKYFYGSPGLNISGVSSSGGIGIAYNPIQLAPMCGRIEARIDEKNDSLGLSGIVGFRFYEPQTDVNITASGAPYTSFIGDKINKGILFTAPGTNIAVDYTITDYQLNSSITGPTQLLANPMDPVFNVAEGFFGSMNLTTPRTLPSLPAQPAVDPSCAQAARANGSHSGSGTEADPFILCNWDGFSALLARTPDNILGKSFVALGNNIDLTGTTFPSLDLKGLKSLDGRNYRIQNAVLIDQENRLFMFSKVGVAKRIVFLNNRLTGRETSFFKDVGDVEDIFAFDNTLTGTYVRGVSGNSGHCRRTFTKNNIRYEATASSVCDVNVVTRESFSQDDVRFVGVVGSNPEYYGLGGYAIASGSASTIDAGGRIAGVARNFCYKCYSDVTITASNFSYVGGIVLWLDTYGSIEVGESRARITTVGPTSGSGYVGGIAATVGVVSGLSFWYGPTSYSFAKFGHTNLINSVFSGRISGAGFLGGLFGQDLSQTDLFVTNTQVTGTVEGVGVKGSLVGKSQGFCVSSVTPVIKTRNVTKNSTIPIIGDRAGASVANSTDY